MKTKERIDASALLLAGGLGVRMGGNKLYLSHGGEPLVVRLIERLASLFTGITLCVGNGEALRVRREMAPFIEKHAVAIVEDRTDGRGPLEGLHAGLCSMPTEWGFLIGCDMPSPKEAVIRRMWALVPEDADASVARLNGFFMPLHAFYRRSCILQIDAAIAKEERESGRGAKIASFYDGIRLHVVEERALSFLPDYLGSFDNYNTKEELAKLLAVSFHIA